MGEAPNGYLVRTSRKWTALRIANVLIVSQKEHGSEDVSLRAELKKKNSSLVSGHAR
jgi:hypothetical protein